MKKIVINDLTEIITEIIWIPNNISFCVIEIVQFHFDGIVNQKWSM